MTSPAAAPTSAEIRAAADLLRAGKVVAFPTETVYGLGADAANAAAVARIFDLKGRPSDHPLIVHLADADQLSRWAQTIPPAAEKLARAFWPGPLTLILSRADGVLDCVTGGQFTVGLRVPNHPTALALLKAFGGGIAAPSANKFGRVSPTTAVHVREEFPPPHAPAAILDGGPCQIGVESTILDLTTDTPTLLRPGGVTREQLEFTLGHPVPLVGEIVAGPADAATAAPTRAPGLLASHYAPFAEVHLATPGELPARIAALQKQNLRFVVLARPADLAHAAVADCGPGAGIGTIPCNTLHRPLPESDAEYARNLYQYLRDADRDNFDAVILVPPSQTGLGLAIRDRLTRASGQRPAPSR